LTPNEKVLLLNCAALLIGRLPVPLSPEDKAFLAPLVGGNDWAALQTNMLALVRAVAEERV
jgi:hypothetical protein